MMAARTLAVQVGYMIGAATGGAAVATAGYGALGAIMVAGMTLSAVAMATVPDAQRPVNLDTKRWHTV
jgi:predicted MFS family arabinose efflux permease